MTFIERITAFLDKKESEMKQELYTITIYTYDYATGTTMATNYFRNPFRQNDDPKISTSIGTGFWPSLTRKSAGYV